MSRRKNYNLTISLPLKLIDRPGELAKITKLMLKAGVHIENVYMLGRNPEEKLAELAFKVNDIEKAKEVLG